MFVQVIEPVLVLSLFLVVVDRILFAPLAEKAEPGGLARAPQFFAAFGAVCHWQKPICFADSG